MSMAPPIVTNSLDRMRPPTLLSMERFFRVVSYSPILGNQVIIMHNELQRDSSCSDPVLEYTWQYKGGGRPGRQEFANAIQQAEDMIYRTVKFSAAPRWFSDEVNISQTKWINSWGGFGFRTNSFHLIEPGVERLDYLVNAPLTYEDADGDGYKDTCIVGSFITTVTDPNQIAVFMPGYGTDPAYEIRPLRVKLALDGVCEIAFPRHLAVRPDLQERLDAAGIDGMDDANFLLEVDIYRRYSDPYGAVEIEWACGRCGDCTVCQTSTATGCMLIQNPRNGLVYIQPARWQGDEYLSNGGQWVPENCLWVTSPARIKLNYRAGFTDSRVARKLCDMAPELERAVAFLALSYLDRDWLACEQIRNLQAHWRFDLAKSESTAAQSSSFTMDEGLFRCPFGTTRAALYAWRVIQPLMVGEAVLNI
jgi:hypothetical protein